MHEQDGDTEPAHHARRPMNAFLIFCKRHRSVVREKYPNLENRSITKILGEWWANLDKEEKACYTGLAKQYKDAFFTANPDFKWYKLPAPPLRTLSVRPREIEKEITQNVSHDIHAETTNNNSTEIDLNEKPRPNPLRSVRKPFSMFTPGKLADEAQMGGLSSLLATKTEPQTPNPYYSPHTPKYNAISTRNDGSHTIIVNPQSISREDSIRDLQNALSETTRIFVEDFEKVRRYSDQPTNQDVIDQIIETSYSKDDDGSANWSEDDKYAGRTCKGKRYQQFMAVGGLIINKRQKREDKSPDEGYNASCSWDPSSSHDSVLPDDSKETTSLMDTSTENSKIERPDTPEDNNANKNFKAADFDLDAKIRALPSLSLEKFQQKKRENKRKKKTTTFRPRPIETPQIINSVPRPFDERRDYADSLRETVIGSQKRKPRKVSITRLEINSLVTSEEATVHKSSPEIKLATEAPCTTVHSMELCRQPAHESVDLFALATLAEVAANKAKIESSIDFTAKASDASKV